jgi:hypothetical protein
MTEKKNKLTIDEALSEYYKLKSKYEETFHEKYLNPILRDTTKSKREKRIEYQKLPKPECINCRRNVGSIFSIKKNAAEYFRQFIAKCGDLNDPCPFNINIEYTQRSELNKELLDHDHDINIMKNKIITDKNNMMFGYVNQADAIVNFNYDTTELKDITETVGYILNINIEINDNPIRSEMIKSSNNKFGNELLIPFKKMIDDYVQTGNTENVNTAVKLYVDEMIPLAKTIRDLKYEICYVDVKNVNERNEFYFLTQKKNSLQNLEYTVYGNDELKSFITGYKESKDTTRKVRGELRKNKTRKARPVIELEEVSILPVSGEEKTEDKQEDVTNIIEPPQEIEFEIEEIVSEINPVVNPNGSISWMDINNNINNEYQQIWYTLRPQYQDVLSRDPVWMKKTLDNFVEFYRLRREKKIPYNIAREFVHPDGLLLPPRQINEIEYDYGNSFYNSVLNEGTKPNFVLSFLPKSPSGSYQQYLDALASIIGNKVGFTNK